MHGALQEIVMRCDCKTVECDGWLVRCVNFA